ncbi:DUF4267 domain-containing protein [Kineococcus rhizosphaerae]|uniref:Uncharacterized protein DUF4267 n=1 Tax=Kineococcus rhizosphaerae TaxID=559628 RepID=A0A2T0R096_9ACTN|nr:DUF4267 domain-containing protein [Kineococcus rhizosphaerae]PRY12533.1 uncharacterized protein DUF4267 [Kineococcus rhizosphaerae]
MTVLTAVALAVAIAGCLFILSIGARFLLAPRVALTGFGVPQDDPRALTNIKGVRDITSGIVPLVVLAAAGQHALGWVLLAAAITPVGDALIVTRNGGTVRHALSVHASTAAVLVVAGLLLALS